MHSLPLSEFRANLSDALDRVERGEAVRIMRHGKPVADLVPASVDGDPQRVPHWKKPFDPVQLPAGAALGDAVLDARDGAPW